MIKTQKESPLCLSSVLGIVAEKLTFEFITLLDVISEFCDKRFSFILFKIAGYLPNDILICVESLFIILVNLYSILVYFRLLILRCKCLWILKIILWIVLLILCLFKLLFFLLFLCFFHIDAFFCIQHRCGCQGHLWL